MTLSRALFSVALGAHGALVLLGAFFWIRFARSEAQRNGVRFQYNIADVYAGIFGLLPWLWLLTVALRASDPPDPGQLDPRSFDWCLAMLLFFLGTGWYLGVLNRLVSDYENRESFVLALLATLLFQYLVVAVFVILSVAFFALATALAEHFIIE